MYYNIVHTEMSDTYINVGSYYKKKSVYKLKKKIKHGFT